MTQQVNGYGVSGVITSELSFELLTSDYIGAGANAEVTLTSDNISLMLPTFYINSRKKSKGIISFSCLDNMMKTDQPLNANYIPNNTISVGNLLSDIALQCGFTSAGGVPYSHIRSLTRQELTSKSCRQVLETLSTAMCGYFYVAYPNILNFNQWGEIASNRTPINYAPISVGEEKGPILRLIMTGNDTVYDKGGTTADVFNTLKIDTEFATEDLAQEIYDRIANYTYTSWQCEKMMFDFLPELDSKIKLVDNTTLTVNSIATSFTSTGIYCSCGRNEVTENEFDYTGELSRKISEKISDGEKLGNQSMVTRYQGVVHLGEKHEENGVTKQNTYAYGSASAQGVVEFSGAMTSKVVPQSVVVSDTADTATYTLGDKKYQLGITWSGDNISAVSRTEVVE